MMIRCDYRAEAEVARPKHRDSYLVCPDSRDQELPFPDFRDRKTKARLSRPRRIWRDPAGQEMAFPDFPEQDGDGATFQTNMETARL